MHTVGWSKCTGIPAALPHLLYSKEEEEQEGDDDEEEVEKEEREEEEEEEGAQDGVENDAVQEARYTLYRIKKNNKEREVILGEEAIEERAYQKKRVFLPSWRQSSLRGWPPPLAAVCCCSLTIGNSVGRPFSYTVILCFNAQ
ncbi:hypothetical protein PV327_009083 [Microctonus hyperodae]|uniref:Uncharacterized protein n=1 Tax=Microctonus hyperodae TaxID=165561 RepID=A0AA39FTI3_MICHY|nr:hypothetical protein PV327_009083 [Microctonus hyperodae]